MSLAAQQGWKEQAPDRLEVVERLAREFPEEWKRAHTGGPGTEDFVRRLAWVLHQEDPRWGLNGKRGTTDASDDLVAYLNPTVKFAHRPDLQGCEAFDIIKNAGLPIAEPYWNNITDQEGSGSLWIKPQPVGGTPNQPPVPPPDPTLAVRVAALEATVTELSGVVRAMDATVAEHDALIAALQLAQPGIVGRLTDLETKTARLPSRGSLRIGGLTLPVTLHYD